MMITIGTKLGAYEILAPLSKGGMGEVYRAKDTRLDREVAIKVLPTEFARDADRLKRFEQEARATSALNHPNILTVYDIGEHEGSPFIVSELLEGEELRAQLNNGALPVRKAIDYAQQIAAGLAAAHEKSIVHRDLKPANLFVTTDGRVKILDFGLAKLQQPRRGEEESTLSLPSERNNEPHTDPGVVMGTVGYMSPEQVQGQVADHRSDIFSFGVILYEMLSGQRAFTGSSMVETMHAILKNEPPELSETNAKISPALDKIVRRCLEKKPEQRFQTASDLGFALEAMASVGNARALAGNSGQEITSLPMGESPGQHAGARAFPGWRERIWMLATAALLLVALAFAWAYFRRAPAESRATYTYLPWPEKTLVSQHCGSPAISPDGRRVAFTAVTEGTNHIWLYSLDAPEPVHLPGTEGGWFPFWSPDSRYIGFFSGGKLRKIDAAGGAPEPLCDVPNGFGGSWSGSGVIIFSPATVGSGLYRVSDKGGVPTPITQLDAARLETQHMYPQFLPDGRHFLFCVGSSGKSEIWVGSLDQPQTSFLLQSDSNAEFSTAGYLVFMRGRKLLAQQFDAEKLVLHGDPITLADQSRYLPTDGYAPLSVGGDRLLIYQGAGNPNTQLVWVNRNGKQLAQVTGASGEYRGLNLAPDGGQVILDRFDPQKVGTDIWLFDLARETLTRVTSQVNTLYPQWSPDGKRIAFDSDREGFHAIWQKGLNGSDEKEELLFKEASHSIFLVDWTNDGKYLLYWKIAEKTGVDLWLLPLDERRARPLLATPYDEEWGKVSPNGRWLAYQSNESGPNEIYVQAFPELGQKVTISKGGGEYPRWRRDGRELYYVSADEKLMAVPVETGANFSAGTPVALFEVGGFGRRNDRYAYDVSADGQKILILRPLEDTTTRPLTVVQNWTELLKK